MKLCRPNDGISRIDPPEKHNHGRFVRITLQGEKNSKFFADTSHRGKQAVLTEARRHRDTLVKKTPSTTPRNPRLHSVLCLPHRPLQPPPPFAPPTCGGLLKLAPKKSTSCEAFPSKYRPVRKSFYADPPEPAKPPFSTRWPDWKDQGADTSSSAAKTCTPWESHASHAFAIPAWDTSFKATSSCQN
jgi:hypothetical protein